MPASFVETVNKAVTDLEQLRTGLLFESPDSGVDDEAALFLLQALATIELAIKQLCMAGLKQTRAIVADPMGRNAWLLTDR